MRSRLQFFIVFLVAVLSGCAIKVVDVERTIPDMDMREKFPLRAAVLIREPSLALDTVTRIPQKDCTVGGSAKSFTRYPFGKIYEDVSRDIFSQMFTEVEVVHQLSVSKEYDVIIEANLDQISNRPGCGVSQNGLFRAEGSLRILDRDLNELWKSQENAADENYEIGIIALDPKRTRRIVSECISQSIISLVRGWGQELKSSLVLYKYVKSLRNAQRRTANLSEGVSAAPIISDVDEIPPRKAQENKNAYAIVIGVEQYRQQLPRAEFAVHDAQAVAQYLTKTLGYPENNVITLLNEHAAKSDFEKYFEKWLPNNVEKNATVFVYYSGHGAPNLKNGDAYLVPYDGDPSFIAETGYPLRRMYDALGRLPAKEVIVAIDSCFSGAGGRSVVAKGARPLVMNLMTTTLPRNMTVLSASAGDQTSSTYDDKGHGLFTYFLLKGIKNEDVTKSDGSISMSDLFGYLKPQVERIARKQYNNEQTPQLIEPRK